MLMCAFVLVSTILIGFYNYSNDVIFLSFILLQVRKNDQLFDRHFYHVVKKNKLKI
jgi:hypothetical protein